MLNPSESGILIASRAKDVTINDDAIGTCAKDIAKKIASGELHMEKMFVKTDVHPEKADRAGIDWVFFADTLNFSFWMPEAGPQYLVTYKGTTYTGYLAFCAAMNRSLDAGVPLTDPKYFRDISSQDLGKLLMGDDGINIPLLDKRVECLHEVGKVLSDQFSGSFNNMLDICENSCVKLLELVLEHFPCFRDCATRIWALL